MILPTVLPRLLPVSWTYASGSAQGTEQLKAENALNATDKYPLFPLP